jgi:hypothetical protein
MPNQTETPAPISISTNTIIGNKFYTAGEPLPFARVEDLPENLRPLVVSNEPEPEEPNVARANFQTGVLYEVTDDNRLGRALRRNVQRQVAELEAAAEEDEWVEEQLDAPLPPQIAESLQEAHEDAVAFAKAQLAADAARSDAASDAAATAAEPPTLFVRRGSRHYAVAHKAKLKPGEPVFVRQPEGRFECIGTTSGDSELPDPPTIL